MVVTRKDNLPVLQQKFSNLSVVIKIQTFGITRLSLPFLNPQLRDKALDTYVLIRL
jgi:hypothetical protein